MRKPWYLLVLLAIAGDAGNARATSGAAGVAWQAGTLDEALARARAEKKWVLVDVYATWCGPCHEMDAKTWSRADVAKPLAEHFVALRRDGEEGEGAAIYRRYHVVGYPTLLVLDEAGAEVDRVMGFVEGPELVGLVEGFRRGEGTLASLEQRAKTAKNPALLAEVAKRHALRGDARAVAETDQVVAGDPRNAAGRAADALFVLGKYYYLRGTSQPAEAAKTFERVRREFPTAKVVVDELPYHLAIAQHHLGDDAKAIATLDAWLAAGPDAERYNSYAWCCFKNGFGQARAIAVAEEGLKAFPSSDSLWDSDAELLEQAGRLGPALDAERHAQRLKPDDDYYKTRVSNLYKRVNGR